MRFSVGFGFGGVFGFYIVHQSPMVVGFALFLVMLAAYLLDDR